MHDNIQKLIEISITSFSDELSTKTYAHLVAIEKLLQAEQIRIVELRRIYKENITELKKKIFKNKSVKELLNDYEESYIMTFVIEQKISDRLTMTERARSLKGVSPAIFTV